MGKRRHSFVYASIDSGAGTTCRCGRPIKLMTKVRYRTGRWMHAECYHPKKRVQAKTSRLAPVRQSPLGPEEYKRYMASQHWAARKRAYFSTHVKKCVICDGNVKIHLHHMTYERLGCELDEDMVALCELHHAGAHEHHKIYGGTLKEATLRYIERLQQIYSGL